MKAVVILAAVAALVAFPVLDARAEEKGHNHAHDHGHDHGVEGEGEFHADLGTTEVAGIKVSVSQDSRIVRGKEAAFDLATEGEPQPKAIRAWYGIRTAEGSLKTKAEKEDGGHWHLHVAIPKNPAKGSMLWLEVESEDGRRTKVGFEPKENAGEAEEKKE